MSAETTSHGFHQKQLSLGS